MTRYQKAKALERHAQEYIHEFDKGRIDTCLLSRAQTLLGQADRIRRGEIIDLHRNRNLYAKI